MSELTRKRIESIDLVKGAVILIMALDHVRDFFHADAFTFEPTDLSQTNAFIFFTRLISDFCAPAFFLLAGTSAYFVGRRKTKAELSRFLLTRGVWLVFIEVTIINFGWFFDFHYRMVEIQVIWSLGISMICLAALVHMPLKYILGVGVVMIAGHNLFDNVHFENNWLWSLLHEQHVFKVTPAFSIEIYYPLVPWIGVMATGYCLGAWYGSDETTRKRNLIITGISLCVLFIIIRSINVYGDPVPWQSQTTSVVTFLSFLNLTKYPPSLLFLLFTLGGVLIALWLLDSAKGKVANFFSVFGRVPFFAYVIHLYLIHAFAMIAAELTGFGWESMICTVFVNYVPALKGYGFSLPMVYLLWIVVIAILYPLCKKFDSYKSRNKQKAWLSYL